MYILEKIVIEHIFESVAHLNLLIAYVQKHPYVVWILANCSCSMGYG